MADFEFELDRMLHAAARADRRTPDALMTRILADAAARQVLPEPKIVPVKPGWFVRLADFCGGRGALAGMTAVTVAGFCLGLVQPTSMAALTSVFHSETVSIANLEMLPNATMLWTGTK